MWSSLLVVAASVVPPTSAGEPRPNILLLMADQMRFDTLTPELTPTLAELAKSSGLTLSRTYSSTPSCTPARSALLTGLSPWYHGMLGYGDMAPAWPFEMPREIGSLGYQTVSIGKNHYYNGKLMPNASSPPPSHGWEEEHLYDGLGSGMDPNGSDGGEYDDYDRFFANATEGKDPLATGKPNMDWNSWRGSAYVYDESLHPTAWVGRTARDWITAYAASSPTKPFFLKVSWHRPHSPYDPPARLLNATPASSLPPVRVSGTWDARFADTQWCGPSDVDAWCGAMPADELDLGRRAYRASIKFVDEQIDALLGSLDAAGLRDNTWIIFFSDHGDGQGDHNLFRKTYPWELAAHVPGLIVWPPGASVAAQPGSVSPRLSELRDVFATALDLAGAPPALLASINGTSWACLARKDPSGATCGKGGGPWRTQLDMEHSTIFNATNHWNAIVSDDNIKYIYFATTGGEMLHNLTADPFEMVDVADDAKYAAQLAALRNSLAAQFLREGRGPKWVTAEGMLVVRPLGTTYGPNFPNSAPPQPPIPPCDGTTTWTTTTGGYFKGDNLEAFSGMTFEEAQASCCSKPACAGLDFAVNHANNKGAGFLKVDAMGGWQTSAVYIGSYKPGQACTTC
jgi:arylsulfatase A-like enzyme